MELTQQFMALGASTPIEGCSVSELSMRAPKSSLGNRSWTSGCETHMEVDENGRLRTEGQYFSSLGYDPLGNCRLGSLGARTFIPV